MHVESAQEAKRGTRARLGDEQGLHSAQINAEYESGAGLTHVESSSRHIHALRPNRNAELAMATYNIRDLPMAFEILGDARILN